MSALLIRSKETAVRCQKGCPVLLVEQVVQFNAQTYVASAKLTFQNAASVAPVSSLAIAIDCFNLHGQPCGRLEQFTYPHLAVALNGFFGYRVYVALVPESYRIRVSALSVEFADGTVWMREKDQDFLQTVVHQPDLSSLGTLAAQYRRK